MSHRTLALTAVAWLSAASTLAAQERLPCEGPEADPWVADFLSRVEAFDALYQFVVDEHGPPTTCAGTVTMEFDGARFGLLMLGFPDGVAFSVETLPPESGVTTLRAASGFPDLESVRGALESYAAGRGLAIDWSTPEIVTEGDEVVQTFWDPEPGLNASASLIFVGDALVGVRLSLAL